MTERNPGHRPMIAVHGGAGDAPDKTDGCVKAAEAGMSRLRDGIEALEATLAAVVLLEDDPRFNAGSGSGLRMDGETVEMDASVMDTRGRLGAVAGIQKVKNPCLVARAVADTPHVMLAGEGATAFARALGYKEYYCVTNNARQRHREVTRALTGGRAGDFPAQWLKFDVARHWNYRKPWQEVLDAYGSGTVGAVALDAEGHFAVCTSTGGSAPMLFGRVGDSPIVGCGFYCGPAGAVGATGVGEYIIREMLSRTVYGWIEQGMPLEEALHKGVDLFPPEIAIGLIGVTRDHAATASNRRMPAHVILGS